MPEPRKRPSLQVKRISKEICKSLVLRYHYSGRVPGIKHCWGLIEGERIVGCVLYSIPASYTLCNGVCGPDLRGYVLELSRLVVITKRENAASFLIGQSLQNLPPSIVVSYADRNEHVGHVGYVYQATNWIYTGTGNAEPLWIDPRTGGIVSYTRRHIDTKAAEIGLDWKELTKKKQLGKHRYVYFTGDRRFKKRARKELRYTVHPYPKGDTRRHEGQVESVQNRKENIP